VADHKREEMTRLGLLGLAPLAIGAAAAWLSPILLPFGAAYAATEFALLYAGLSAAYRAGIGAGAALKSDEKALPGMIAALVALFAIWPGSSLYLRLDDFLRYVLVIGVLAYLLMRDLRAIEAKQLPAWYGPLRMRITFWSCMALALIAVRQLI
jgi:hypothetical protein